MSSLRPVVTTVAFLFAVSGSIAPHAFAQSGGGGGGSGGGGSGGSSGSTGGAGGGTSGSGPGGTATPSGPATGAPSALSPSAPGAVGTPTTPSPGTVGSPSVDPLRRVNPTPGVNPNVGVPNAANPPSPGVAQPPIGGSSASSGGTSRTGQRATVDPVKQCLSDWDAGTHISRKRWAEICRDRSNIGADPGTTTGAASKRMRGARASQ